MPEEKKADDVDKLLSAQKALEDRKQTLIDKILKDRDTANAAFDAELAKLGYRANSGKGKRSHHKRSGASPETAAAAKAPAKPKS